LSFIDERGRGGIGDRSTGFLLRGDGGDGGDLFEKALVAQDVGADFVVELEDADVVELGGEGEGNQEENHRERCTHREEKDLRLVVCLRCGELQTGKKFDGESGRR
jgi:hypothetical protein